MDVFNLPWAGYFHRCIVRDWHIDELTLRRIDENVNFINGFTLACHGWFAKFVKHSCYMVWVYQCTSIKIYSQLSILGMLGMSSVYLCAREWLKNDDIVACIVAAFFSTHMHIRWVGIYFHEFVLPCEKSEISTPHKKQAIRCCLWTEQFEFDQKPQTLWSLNPHELGSLKFHMYEIS